MMGIRTYAHNFVHMLGISDVTLSLLSELACNSFNNAEGRVQNSAFTERNALASGITLVWEILSLLAFERLL